MPKSAVTSVVAAAAAKSRQGNPLIDALNLALADTYALMALTHLAHWNVEGDGFFQLHEAFGTQYTALFEAADEIAERVRALGDYAVGGLQMLAGLSGLSEFKAPMSQKDYVSALLAAHEKTLLDLASARALAEKAGDLETQDLMIGRVQAHQKTAWMLKSFLKG